MLAHLFKKVAELETAELFTYSVVAVANDCNQPASALVIVYAFRKESSV